MFRHRGVHWEHAAGWFVAGESGQDTAEQSAIERGFHGVLSQPFGGSPRFGKTMLGNGAVT